MDYSTERSFSLNQVGPGRIAGLWDRIASPVGNETPKEADETVQDAGARRFLPEEKNRRASESRIQTNGR